MRNYNEKVVVSIACNLIFLSVASFEDQPAGLDFEWLVSGISKAEDGLFGRIEQLSQGRKNFKHLPVEKTWFGHMVVDTRYQENPFKVECPTFHMLRHSPTNKFPQSHSHFPLPHCKGQPSQLVGKAALTPHQTPQDRHINQG